jgi:membrane fusion protein (multidrug efflux system)
MLIMLLLAGLFIWGFYHHKMSQIHAAMEAQAHFAMPSTAVTTLVAKKEKWQPVLNAVGSLRAVNGVDISTDLAGIVEEIGFESGAPVKKGDLIVKLDTKQEEAQLKSAMATSALAKLNLTRQRELLSKRATSQSDYDSAAATADQQDANAEQVRALIARKTILAPFDGVLGIRQVNIGQYLDVGKPIVTLQSQDPIYVEFSLPQQDLEKVAIGKTIQIKAAGIDNRKFEGKITAINSKVDEATRNISVEATISNKDGSLRGGMFVQVEVLLPEQEGVVAIPSSSVNYAPFGDSVYLVKNAEGKDGKPGGKQAIQTFVKLGPARGDQVSVLSGVKEGDEVITSGGFKVNSGAPVVIDNSVQPSNNPAPQPPET